MTPSNHRAHDRASAAADAALALLAPAVRNTPVYIRHAVWERLSEPECTGSFAVSWMDDGGSVHADRAYFAVPGPGEGVVVLPGAGADIRTHCFLSRLRAALLGRPAPVLIGTGASAEHLTDGESMRLCRALRDGMDRLAPGTASRRADGFRARERGYLDAAGDPMAYAGAEAEGLCLFAGELMRHARSGRMEGRTAAVWGHGAQAAATAACAARLGLQLLPGDTAAEIVFLCCPGRTLRSADAEALFRSGTHIVLEGTLGACAPEAAVRLRERGVTVAPAIAAGAGGDLAPSGEDRWESGRRLRRGMRELLARTLSAGGGDPYRGAYALALTAAAEALVRRGV